MIRLPSLQLRGVRGFLDISLNVLKEMCGSKVGLVGP